MGKVFFVVLLFISCTICGQPYLDITRFNYSYSPKQGLNEKTSPLRSNFFTADVTLPIELKKGGDAFIVNPFLTNNTGEVSTKDFHVISEGFLLGFLKKIFSPIGISYQVSSYAVIHR